MAALLGVPLLPRVTNLPASAAAWVSERKRNFRRSAPARVPERMRSSRRGTTTKAPQQPRSPIARGENPPSTLLPDPLVLVLVLSARLQGVLPLRLVAVPRRSVIRRRVRLALIGSLLVIN